MFMIRVRMLPFWVPSGTHNMVLYYFARNDETPRRIILWPRGVPRIHGVDYRAVAGIYIIYCVAVDYHKRFETDLIKTYVGVHNTRFGNKFLGKSVFRSVINVRIVLYCCFLAHTFYTYINTTAYYAGVACPPYYRM